MSGITQSMCASFEQELLQAVHNFTNGTGHVFKIALIKGSPTGTYDAASTNYSNITGNSDEATATTGYTAGGATLSANITPASSGSGSAPHAYTSWTVNPTWTVTGTLSTAGAMIYNSSASNKAVGVLSFGGTQSVTAGTFTITLPANAAGTSILQLN